MHQDYNLKHSLQVLKRLVESVLRYGILKLLFYHTFVWQKVKVDPSPYKCMAKLQFLKFHNLQLTLPISSRTGGNIQDYTKSDCYGKHVNNYVHETVRLSQS